MPENGQVTVILKLGKVCVQGGLVMKQGNTWQESFKASSLKNGPARRLNKLAATVL